MPVPRHACSDRLEEADNDFANDEDYENVPRSLETASRHVAPLAAEEKKLLNELREFATTPRPAPTASAHG